MLNMVILVGPLGKQIFSNDVKSFMLYFLN